MRAEDFLLAPLDPEDLISSLVQLLRRRMEAEEQYLPVKVGGVWGPLNMAHILYLESAGHSLIFHMDDGRQFRSISSFKDYQSLIDLNRHFFRCHKSYVVNLSHVTGWSRTASPWTTGTPSTSPALTGKSPAATTPAMSPAATTGTAPRP